MHQRIALFDWTPGGHHELYVQRFAEALAPDHEPVACVPDETAATLAERGIEVHGLGEPRPAVDPARPAPPQHAELAQKELGLLERTVDAVRPDHVVHMYADPIVRRLVKRPPLGVPASILYFFPQAHYPRVFGTPMSARDRARALMHELVIARWRRRPDAASVLLLDPVAAERWGRRRGAPVQWVGEPPLPAELPDPPAEREGAVLYGSLAARKGIDLLAAAMATAPGGRVTLAGGVEAGFADQLSAHVDRMRAAGTDVVVREGRLGEGEGLATLAAARVAVLPYPAHGGMSRVMLEAAGVGTPVVVHDRGLLAHLVREHDLGITVDCRDPHAFRRAVDTVQAEGPERRAAALARFAAGYSAPAFRARLLAGLGLPAPALPVAR